MICLFSFSLLVWLSLGCLKASAVYIKKPVTESSEKVTIVFAHYDIQDFASFGEGRNYLSELIREFEKKHPNIEVKEEILPSYSDQQHQYLVINLEGKTTNIDVIALDVIWVKEFAKAKWILPLDDYIKEEDKRDFVPILIDQANTYQDRIYALPWMLNSGLIYYRKDLLEKYNFDPPKTFEELERQARYILKQENDPSLYGFVWQGTQQEGLVCNALEYIYGVGGKVLAKDHVAIDSMQVKKAFKYMKDMLDSGISPNIVKTSNITVTRRLFLEGHVIFIRDWAMISRQVTGKNSVMHGKVGILNVPHFEGYTNAPILGGHQLGINQYSKHPRESFEFINYITSPESQKYLALYAGYKPSRKSVYQDKELTALDPFLKRYYEEIVPTIQSRPLSPYYVMFSNILQSEFAAIVTGIRPIDEALTRAKTQIEFITNVSKENES